MEDQFIQPYIQTLKNISSETSMFIDVLRLDVIHPIISGNKRYKLKYYLQEALQQQKKQIVTFGGAYSNHIVATAFACKQIGIKSIGIIRGDDGCELTHTLKKALEYEMELEFVSRKDYMFKNELSKKYEDAFVIPEGGAGELGVKGAADILKEIKIEKYDYIICACGTGTMISGFINGSTTKQKVIGINVLKGFEQIELQINHQLNNKEDKNRYTIFNEYHFGGYAKHPQPLIDFMAELWQRENVPTDIVYTSKLFYGVIDLLKNNYFPKKSNILVIHSGGLQGNLSLAKGRLLF